MDQLRAIRYFIAVAESGSFTEASRLLRVPSSSLSRRVSDLERQLGAALLERSTRLVRLTEVGERYYRDTKEILARLAQSDEAVGQYHARPVGVLRISCQTDFGQQCLLPLLDDFQQAFPHITLDITLSDDLVDLGPDGVDIAIRGGTAPEKRLVAVRLRDNNFIPVASPDYLDRQGRPARPQDLAGHQALIYRTPMGPVPWMGEEAGQWQRLSPQVAAVSNDGAWLIGQALASRGILMLPRWAVEKELAQGSLEALALKVSISPGSQLGVYLLYQHSRYYIPKIREAVDFLVARLKA
ncbi:LysR family transcriptional regulator [Gallaecimonas xiamenensis]|uniref:LysR family transcriptional regulator n=1 Tax=Gallaecimonas xiamenensis 3-C-1 TaxID=745411 RepID=K2JRK8_9GAMM|nr:LysR family transcriptional regulator [Gallaecimonas xiamenensis]EKE77122.1 LysR family transcriptional regulator [Gallaecimonas xiamenensis 3-C-1]